MDYKKRELLLKNFHSIIARNEQNTLKKLEKKRPFFSSNEHMIQLPTPISMPLTSQTKTHTNVKATEDTDIDDIDPDLFMEENNKCLKRKASLASLSSYESSLPHPQAETHIIHKTQIPVPHSKNLRATRHSSKMKALTQG